MAGDDVEGGAVDQCLWGVASSSGVGQFGRVDAETLGEDPRRVAVAPREQVDHAERVDRGRQGGEPGIGDRGVHGVDHQGDRLDTILERRGTVDVLTDPDDDRGARIEGHRPAR